MSEENKKRSIVSQVLRGIVFSFVALFGLGTLLAIFVPTQEGTSSTAPAPSTTATDSSSLVSALSGGSDLTVENMKFSRGQFGNLLVTGTVKNPTSKQFTYAQVEINLYDKDGAQVGSTLANVNNLEPNGIWKFEAAVLQNEGQVKTAKVKGITAF